MKQKNIFMFFVTLVLIVMTFSTVQAETGEEPLTEEVDISASLEEEIEEAHTDEDEEEKEATSENEENPSQEVKAEQVEKSDTLQDSTDVDVDVENLKKNLEQLGFGSLGQTSDFDTKTEEAVKEFQSYYGLTVNGQADSSTLSKIEELLASPFQSGKRHEQTIDLKENLYTLGYWDSKSGTTLYGTQTEKAIRAFQQDEGLPQSGIAEDTTRSTLAELAQQPLRKGMYRQDAIELKSNLERLGFGSFVKTDYYGPKTAKVVKSFQSAYDLTTTGTADKATLDKMDELLKSPFQKGKRHKETVTLKESLYILGYWDSKKGTTLYGSQTEKAVKQFQKDQNIRQTGIADDVTRAKLAELAQQPLQKGMYRQDAVELKDNLERLGFGSFAKTDYYGPQTEKVVKSFQSAYNLSSTGIADKATLDKMDELLKSPFQKGKRHKETVTLKENLYILGYWDSKKGTTLYGSQTEKAVKQFQKAQNIRQTGIADDVTRAKLAELAQQPLQKGMYRQDAIKLKGNLERLGFGSFAKTDYYGPKTAKVVKSFQSTYGLTTTGTADKATLNKMDELLKSPFQKGKRHKETVTLKENLYILGYWDSKKGTTLYGSQTEKAVKQFQKDQNIRQTGIADDVTRAKLADLAQQPLQKGMYRQDAIELKANLERLGFGSFVKNDYFGPKTEKVLKQAQSYYGVKTSGIADKQTLAKIQEVVDSPLQNRNRHADVVKLKKDLRRLGFWNSNGTTNLYASKTEKAVRSFQKHYSLKENGIADQPTLSKIASLLASPNQKGNSSSDIRKYKEQLIFLGYKKGISSTSVFGSKTEARVKEFQRDMNLPVSGILDVETLKVLDNAYNNRAVQIFIDPGHGDMDSGGTGYGLKEKDVVLKIGTYAKDYLEQHYEGVDVKMSRSTDEFLALEQRAKLANDWQADYFVSIHTNAFNGKARGFESYIHNGKVSNATKQLQREIHTYIVNDANVRDRGMKQADFSVLRNTNMPAVLLEFLFIDNSKDNELLKDEAYLKKLGTSTAKAIATSFNLVAK
ncbi:peptidoglycan-binding protein [Gracilibacillus sp. S3-1-1]|uniref:Peptidoglycan-binding protein n=1 Tax=Gracilibacillus pellucidus TaxID=3095368 RepID=A0ACC6M836_9BACI|nr:peptidoglycan-binding protein [Gracilibacillus sp. S3-1-1]MDX8047099.1 peptidoglycan-binding protein [Gracilibacillus sp. S3-1-1]